VSLTVRWPTHVPEKGYEGELELRANSVANGRRRCILGITAGIAVIGGACRGRQSGQGRRVRRFPFLRTGRKASTRH